MSLQTATIIQGYVKKDPCGGWGGILAQNGVYLDGNHVADLFEGFKDKKLRVTIEVISEENP